MRVYLDSAPIIYLVENISPFVTELIEQLSSDDIQQVCSDLSRLECRVKPIRDNESILLTAFDTYFSEIVSDIVPLTRAVMDYATEIRAQFGFKTPDAIHLACAVKAKCARFYTNDSQLKRFTEMEVIFLEGRDM